MDCHCAFHLGNSKIKCTFLKENAEVNLFIFSANTTDLGVLDPSLYKADCLVEDQLWPEGHVVIHIYFTYFRI